LAGAFARLSAFIRRSKPPALTAEFATGLKINGVVPSTERYGYSSAPSMISRACVRAAFSHIAQVFTLGLPR